MDELEGDEEGGSTNELYFRGGSQVGGNWTSEKPTDELFRNRLIVGLVQKWVELVENVWKDDKDEKIFVFKRLHGVICSIGNWILVSITLMFNSIT